MREAFHSVSGNGDKEHGKLGAAFAVIVAHVVPFMGAQTTIMQRYFLPHPADTIVSQPFGMTEDLISMAMAEALSNPVLASLSLTALIVFFNLARGFVFSVQQGTDTQHQHSHSFINNDVVGNNGESIAQSKKSETSAHQAAENVEEAESSAHQAEETVEEAEFPAQQDTQDYPAIAGAGLNILVGFVATCRFFGGMVQGYAFFVVAFQMMVQLFVVPIALRYTFHHFRATNPWTSLPQSPPEPDRHDPQHCASQMLAPQQGAFPLLLGSLPSSDSPKNFPKPYQI